MEFQFLPRFYLLVSLSILFLAPFHAQAKIKVTYCDKKADYAVKVSGVEISPNPVVSGQAATFKISATSGKAIYGGEVVIGVSYVGVPVHTERIDLCEEVTCPVANGNFLISHTQTLPAITPPAKTKPSQAWLVSTPTSGRSSHLRLLRENFSLQAAVRDRCVAAGARRRRLCRCVAAGGRRGCVCVRLRVSRLGVRVGCGRDAAGAGEARGLGRVSPTPTADKKQKKNAIFRHPAITATTAMAMAAAIPNPPRHRYSVAFFRKTAMKIRHGTAMAAI
ncbi:MD-2-related lipid-recognition protein ROSY1 [Glycine soja]